ncbi:hypothetical protein D2E25_0263 [Bifidobacterium goeldii]|uniref:Uncharacterized protein n=1 Tax=Bifidobacterium goeldii TaxID=2306975 RepID=A0A430FMA3_9BIFI|nr:hypothetical protein [Bifidobacterium goeldii]RSX53957.1 hypothetical protein D2E25_0263 [Bifidobacterium goeldii]
MSMREYVTITYHAVDEQRGYHHSIPLASADVDQWDMWHPMITTPCEPYGYRARDLKIALDRVCHKIIDHLENMSFED